MSDSDPVFQLGASIDAGFSDAGPGDVVAGCGGGLLSGIGGFLKGFAEGAWDGVTGMVKGVVDLAEDGYKLATDGQFRQQTWTAAVKDAQAIGNFAYTAATNPGEAAHEVSNGASNAWHSLTAAYDQAAANGQGSEFIGKIFGQGAVLVGTALIPGGAEADVVGGVGDAGRATELLGDVAKGGELAADPGVTVAGDAATIADGATEAGAPGAINFMDGGDQFLSNAANRADVDPGGMLDMVAHGDPNGIVINGTYSSAEDAAQVIRANSQFAGQPLRLLSCSTGAGPTCFAQRLASELGVPVTAPSDTLWAFSDGSMTIGQTPVANSGSWVTFLPGEAP